MVAAAEPQPPAAEAPAEPAPTESRLASVITSLVSSLDNKREQKRVVRELKDIAAEQAKAIVDAGGVRKLLGVIATDTSDVFRSAAAQCAASQMRGDALCALADVSAEDGCEKAIVRDGGVAVLVDTVLAGNDVLQEHGLRALANVMEGDDECQRAVQHVVNEHPVAMKRFRELEADQTSGKRGVCVVMDGLKKMRHA